MADATTTLQILLTLKDEATAAMASVASTISGTLQSVSDKVKSVGNTIQSSGQTLTTDITLPIVGIGIASAKAAANFQADMELLRTQAGYSQADVDTLTQSVLKFVESGQSQSSADDIAQGLFHVASNGIPAANAMDAVTVANKLAAVGQISFNDAVNATTSLLHTGVGGLGDFTGAASNLSAAVGAGNMHMADFTSAMSSGIMANAKTIGLPFQDVAGAVAEMTSNMVPAQDAATRLNMILSLAVSPSASAQKALKSLGMTQYEVANDMRSHGLVFALQDIQTHLKKVNENVANTDIKEMFGGGRTETPVKILLGDLTDLQAKIDQIKNKGNPAEFSQQYFDSLKTTDEQVKTAEAILSGASIDFGTVVNRVLLPALQSIVEKFKEVVDWFDKLSPKQQDMIVQMLGYAAIVGPALMALGTIIKVVGTLLNPVILLLIAIGIEIGIIVSNWQGAMETLGLLWGAFLENIQTVWNNAKLVIKGAGETIKNYISAWLENINTDWTKVWNGIKNFFGNIWNGITAVVKDGINMIIDDINSFINFIDKLQIHIPSVGVGPAKTPAFDWNGLGLPNIPRLAAGGIVTQATLAIIGERGPEAVVPLSNGGFGGTGATNIVININGGQFSDPTSTRKLMNEVARQINTKLKLRTT